MIIFWIIKISVETGLELVRPEVGTLVRRIMESKKRKRENSKLNQSGASSSGKKRMMTRNLQEGLLGEKWEIVNKEWRGGWNQASGLGNPVENRASHRDGEEQGGVEIVSSVYDTVYFKCSWYSHVEVSSSRYRSGDQERIWDGDIYWRINESR